MCRLYLIYTVTLSTDSHSSNSRNSLPVKRGIVTRLFVPALHSASANAIMLLFCISFSPLVMLNTAGAGFLVVGGPCHLITLLNPLY